MRSACSLNTITRLLLSVIFALISSFHSLQSSPPSGTGNTHADVKGTQLKTLQTVFKRLQAGEIDKVEGHFTFQIATGGNKVVTAKQWKERLSKSFLWIDFCCIPQMSIALTEELLGFGSSERGEIEGGNSCGGDGLGSGSLLLVKAAVRQELGTAGIDASFKTSFRRVQRETANHDGGGPVTKGGEDESTLTATSGGKDATTDHRHITSDTEGWKKVNKIMLDKAVQSIPAYIERSSLIVVLVPPCKHADRDDEICDEGSWRGRGWCRVEYLGAALVRSDISVMIVEGALATPAFVFPMDGLQLPPGHGTYTCCSRKCRTTFSPHPCLNKFPLDPIPSVFSTRCFLFYILTLTCSLSLRHSNINAQETTISGTAPTRLLAICTRWRRCCRP